MFRKLAVLLSATALATGVAFVGGGVHVPTAHADSGVSQMCTANMDFGASHGECVSFFQSGSGAVGAHFCQAETYPFDATDKNGNVITISNRGQCIQYLKSFS